jgi:ankyrin repeat protein
MKIRALIDELVNVAENDFCDRAWSGGQFIAVLGGPTSSKPLRDLIQQGAAAIPYLVAHLGDPRPTRKVITPAVGEKVVVIRRGAFITADLALLYPTGARGPGPAFPITVGDLCYVALAQIVNHHHSLALFSGGWGASFFDIGPTPDQIRELTRLCQGMTPARHRAKLIADMDRARNWGVETFACRRLADCYPEALEPLVLPLLPLPTYDGDELWRFVDVELYNATDAQERRKLVEAFVAKHGKAAREGLKCHLFLNLYWAEITPPEMRDGVDVEEQPRRLLVELFGQRPGVRSTDRLGFPTAISRTEKEHLISEVLVSAPSKKFDRAVRDLLATIRDDDQLALVCMDYLAGRGLDADIEAYCRRRQEKLDQEDVAKVRQKMRWTPLHAAVARRNGPLVQRLLAAGSRPDARARNGDTSLHLAARAGDELILRQLVAGKPNLNLKGAAGLTPVQEAIRGDHDAAALVLLGKQCAIPDILVAAVAGRTDLIHRFLEADAASLGHKTNGGRTPLLLAIRHGHASAVRNLLARGALAPPDKPWQPLHLAAQYGHTEVARLLLEKGSKVDVVDKTGRSALFRAVEGKHYSIAQLLLKHRANARLAAKDGEVPLHAAVSTGRTNLIALLLRAGAEVDAAVKETGETPLHRAVRQGVIDVARLLIPRARRVSALDLDGNTALHFAVFEGQEELTRLLLDATADPNVANMAGSTPLHLAAWFGRTKLARLLLDYKAKIDQTRTGRTGETALQLASQQGLIETVRLLLEHRANPLAHDKSAPDWSTPLHATARRGHIEIARLLLARGVPVDVKDSTGRSPLHHAAEIRGDQEAMVRLLLAQKANVRATAKQDWQPIHSAVQAGNGKILGLLLDHKAEVNAREKKDGRTPLHLAIAYEPDFANDTETRVVSLARILLQRKADVTIKDADGITPLASAREKGYAQVVKLLEKYGAKD